LALKHLVDDVCRCIAGKSDRYRNEPQKIKKLDYFIYIYNKKTLTMKNKIEYSKILSWAKKIKAINKLGGVCKECGDDNIFHLTFHHLDLNEKEFNISEIRKDRWSKINKELEKCILLCHNCHNEFHKIENNDYSRFNNNKKLFLEFKNIDSCKICGYNKYNGSLHFHHEREKIFKLTSVMVSYKNINELSNNIVDELNKCIVLCANCHQYYHSDIDFFEKNKIEIYLKSKNIKENTPKIDRILVKKMYFEEGKRQIDIVNFFGCKKGTISDIIKKLKNKLP